ncbi:acid phosphatase [Aspergillus campestris IBT 28561]|uniref:Acid phosphatase n=1 Tax=Aspergillus campestris (strain IBT 28561) TaxID=1392248 RepID=A0A2I1D339_ASPC2|nr:acid phosphatase [Aspergillus campestris IBT 28561]PKY04292.1 acid phosphatase [Aspergillus campestris IBT 28561]
MHILVVNDDGPPSNRLSPYIRPFVHALQSAGHQVSVAIPAASRSWIGKAHLIEASLTATYVPESAFRDDGSWDPAAPAGPPHAQWVVIANGTPASCVQLGLFNLFADRGPIDLVISGPNHGRNASTVYNLSSGTVGGALEAATCAHRAIAISFGSKDPQPAPVIDAAARLASRLVSHLARTWDPRVELYNLNVPMRADVESRPVRYTRALPYHWTHGCLYAETQSNGLSSVQKSETNGDAQPTINGVSHHDRHPSDDNDTTHPLQQRTFAWAAELSGMKKALQASPEGTDAQTVLSGETSITALCANFWHVPGLEGDLVLDDDDDDVPQ